jgi:protein-L-isoaspartate(D-aspartate) O-methyltransferase
MPKNMTNTERLAAAFESTPRQNFVLPLMRDQAHLDQPLPIGDYQTISQPTTVKLMLEWLDVQPGDKILDVGSGSGWSTALLSYLTGDGGQIYAVERVPELVSFGRQNVERLGIKNAEFFEASKKLGLEQYAPYDRILVSASAPSLPPSLLAQLKVGGKLVMPVKDEILEVTKTSPHNNQVSTHEGFVFVPLL